MNESTRGHAKATTPEAKTPLTILPETPSGGFRSITGEQILDSRGYPTVQVTLELEDGTLVEASAPAGASTGANEAVEKRDGGRAYSGRGVHTAVASIADEIAPLLLSRQWSSIRDVDDTLCALDGTHTLARLGANAIVAVSMGATRAFAAQAGVPLHQWIASYAHTTAVLPVPHFNVLNGGAHAANGLEFQEFMIAPVGAATEADAVQAGAEIYHALSSRIPATYKTNGLGDEGGFAPDIDNPETALDLLVEAITEAGYTPGTDHIAIALDPAANGFHEGNGQYRVNGALLSRGQLADYYLRLLDHYPIRSIEDGFAEDDHDGWKLHFESAGDRIQIVGDDLYVKDAERIRVGAREGYSNATLIKPNQIGTVSHTLDAVAAARQNNMASMISHRSGETADTFISDLAVGTGVGQIKSGAPARGERVAKYNRLMHIESQAPGLPYGLGSRSNRR